MDKATPKATTMRKLRRLRREIAEILKLVDEMISQLKEVK
jgi:hypothetical protein